LLKSSELGLPKKIIRGIPDGQGTGVYEAYSRKPLTAVLGIRDSWAGQCMKSWPVADKRLTINEKSICLVVISVPGIYSSISLSMGYPPRPTGPDGSRLTELQPETTGKAFSEILFLQERLDMPCGFVWVAPPKLPGQNYACKSYERFSEQICFRLRLHRQT
jgi:hypothetical protein